MIVKHMNSSIAGTHSLASSFRLITRLKHLTSWKYLTNNREHVTTSILFVSILLLAMSARGLEYSGTFILNVKFDECMTL